MSGHRTEVRQLETVDGAMNVIVSTPIGAVRGGVVVVQEAFGLTGHIERVCEALAESGYIAVAPALFHRCEDQVFGYNDFDKLGPVIMTITQATIETDVDTAFSELARLGVSENSMAILGFCLGGTVTLETAARRKLAAAVTFYGGGLGEGRFGLEPGIESAARLQTPWLGLYGDLDQHISIDEVEQVRIAAASSSVDTEVVRYVDADHGFHCDERPSFHAEASSDAWARTLQFLDEQM
ncbi:MAG: dienelactone hydrolase family protein [Acidimicrobiales bacterium]